MTLLQGQSTYDKRYNSQTSDALKATQAPSSQQSELFLDAQLQQIAASRIKQNTEHARTIKGVPYQSSIWTCI